MWQETKIWLMLFFAVCAVSAGAQFAGGTGTDTDPWLIATAGQLNAIRVYLGNEHSNKHYKLISDIDIGLDSWGYWTPIGTTTPFCGSIDGDYHTISNMTIAYPANGIVGLIGITNNATITNLNLFQVQVTIDVNPHSGYQGSGGLVVQSFSSLIDNCHVSGYISFYGPADPTNIDISYLGGLVGWSDSASTLTNCSSTCSVGASATTGITGIGLALLQIQNVGGLVGLNQGTITNSYATGYSGSTIYNMSTTASPMFSYATGGLIGSNSGVVINCYSTNTVGGNEAVGGLIGVNSGQVRKSFFTGSVQGFSAMGGLVGSNSGLITDSYSIGSLQFYVDVLYIDYWGPYIIGGFLGGNSGTVSNCYSTGNIDWSWVEPQSYCGFVSENSGTVSNCYWDINTSGTDVSAAGLGRLTLDMTYPHSDSTYVGWDFTETWFADSQGIINGGYPFLRWQYQVPVAEFSANQLEGFAPLAVQFSNNSLQGSGGGLQWLWDFGDGVTASEQEPMHIYNTQGVYSVTLTVTDTYGFSSSIVKHDYITVTQPVATLVLTSSNQLNFGSVYVEESSSALPVVLSSTGGINVNISSVHFMGEPLHFELVDPPVNWVVEHGQEATIMVRFTPHTVGTIRDTLYIASDAVNNPVIKVRLSGTSLHVLPISPQNISITMVGNSVQLNWEAVTQNLHGYPMIPDYYFVYISSNPMGGYVLSSVIAVNSAQHPFVAIGADKMFYRITAVKFYRDVPLSTASGDLPSGIRVGMTQEAVEDIILKLDSFRGRE